MKTFIFDKKKYGFPLLMDLHRFEENPNVFFEKELHDTDFFEILVFENANGSIELNGKLKHIKKNSVFFISPYQKKSCDISIQGLKGFHLVFQNDFLSDFFSDQLFVYRLQYFYNAQYPQSIELEFDAYELIRLFFNEIIQEINHFQNDSSHIIRSLLYFVLTKLNRIFSERYQISSDTSFNTKVFQFKALLEQNIRHLHSVEQYCELLQVNRHNLNSMVKKHTGFTTKEIIHNRLIQEIKMALRYSEKTVTEIAHDLHFSEPNNMTRFFKSKTGLNPKDFRLQYQNDSS